MKRNYNTLAYIYPYRYPVRIEAMQIKLEFAEKLVDIKPSIQLLTLGVEGKGRQRGGGGGGEILMTPS